MLSFAQEVPLADPRDQRRPVPADDYRGTSAARPSALDRGLGRAPANAAQTNPRPVPVANVRPLLLVGDLTDLTPHSISVGSHQAGKTSRTIPSRTFDTQALDFRRAVGFDGAIKAAIESLGFGAAADADVKAVNSNADLIKQLKGAGKRQIIYFGHAAGPGALWPGGLATGPIDPKSFAGAVNPDAPRPILIGCHAADEAMIGEPPPGNAIGLNRLLILEELTAHIDDKAKSRPRASEVSVDTIRLSLGEKGYAPQAPLGDHQPQAPP